MRGNGSLLACRQDMSKALPGIDNDVEKVPSRVRMRQGRPRPGPDAGNRGISLIIFVKIIQ